MFKYVLLVALVAYVSAAGDDATAEVKTLESDVRADGFEYVLETTNGIRQVSSGDAKGNVKGEYSWISPEGENIQLSYVADENGYQPQSNLLPTSPPIPAAILKAIEYIASHPSKESTN